MLGNNWVQEWKSKGYVSLYFTHERIINVFKKKLI